MRASKPVDRPLIRSGSDVVGRRTAYRLASAPGALARFRAMLTAGILPGDRLAAVLGL